MWEGKRELAGFLVGRIRWVVFVDMPLQKELHVSHIKCIFDFGFPQREAQAVEMKKKTGEFFPLVWIPLANREFNFYLFFIYSFIYLFLKY